MKLCHDSLCRLVGDEHGMVSVLQYSTEDESLVDTPHHISPDYIFGDSSHLY